MASAFSSENGHAGDFQKVENTIVDARALTFAEGPAARFGGTVNGRSHQQSPIVSYRGYQYVGYVDSRRRVCLARRELPASDWSVIRFEDHHFGSNDSHNTIVIGICKKDGTIHLAFDHHASPLHYRVSKRNVANRGESFDWEPSLFGPIQSALGPIETAERVTYPRFFSSPDGDLMLYYRAMTSGNGDGMIERYDGDAHDWVPGMGKFIARDIGVYEHNGRTSLYRCPYMNSLSFSNQRLHATWVWRDRFEKTNPRNQHDLCYAYSDDMGNTWHDSNGKIIGETGTNPIHLDTPGLVVLPIAPENHVANQNTHYAFDDGSIHVIARQRQAGRSEHRYHHYWRGGNRKWNLEVLPFSGQRPKLVGNKDGVLFLAYTDEVNDEYQLFIARGIPNASRSLWQWERLPTPEQPTFGEPLVDVTRWEEEQVLSVYVQSPPKRIIRTDKRDPIDGVPSPLHVIDFHLKPIVHAPKMESSL
ncbi:BNR repeat-containing protein [Rhodopirellula sallentina]|uniref:BNR repeat-containing protein n=1 Tax=Rhodopirellula sallentina TaxID=1263869 RepID=UPI001F42AD1D|nr:BNR repeat-containing protein [Rhodopirellula sallentina]